MDSENSTVTTLKNICSKIEEKEELINKNFWAVNMHGAELKSEVEIPKGIRIITFCYSGRELLVCPSMDNFIWREILLNEDACFNYCTFLSAIARNSSMRNHFCVYEHGTRMRDLYFVKDEKYFRSGIFKLPIKAIVYDEETDTTFASSPDVFAKAVSKNTRRAVVNISETGRLIKYKNTDVELSSSSLSNNIINKLKLSELIRMLQRNVGEATLLLLTCRAGERRRGMIHPPKVIEELQTLYERYLAQAQERKNKMKSKNSFSF